MVAQIDVGGATLSQVARRHGIHASLLFRWRKTLGIVMGSAPIETEAAFTPTQAPAGQRFVPVMLPPPLSPPSLPLAVPSPPSPIEIVLAGGRTVRVGADVDTGVLLRILSALEKGR